MQQRCSGHLGQVPSQTFLCPICTGTITPSAEAVLPPQEGVCRHCHRPSQTVCLACNRGIHFGQQCQQWLCGVSRWYCPSSMEDHWLCPDCFAAFAAAVRDAPFRPLQQQWDETVSALMSNHAASCAAGAGSATRNNHPRQTRARQVRAGMVRTLQDGRWWSVNRLCREPTLQTLPRASTLHVVPRGTNMGAVRAAIGTLERLSTV